MKMAVDGAAEKVSRLDGWLKGLPNDAITMVLILLAIIIICVAVVARPATKALLIAWIVMP